MNLTNNIQREQMYFKAFCEGAVAGMNHEGKFDNPEEFGEWVRDEFDEWRKEGEIAPGPVDPIRQIIREEIRRESTGARCPECGDTDQGISLEEIEQRADEDREYIWTCWSCECSGPVQIFDPLHQEHPGIYESDGSTYYHCPACTSVFDSEDDALHHVYYEEYEFINSVVGDH